jgi:hypothetical protein
MITTEHRHPSAAVVSSKTCITYADCSRVVHVVVHRPSGPAERVDSGHSMSEGDSMRSTILMAVAASVALCVVPAAAGAVGENGQRSFTMAVYGDSPYGLNNADTSQTAATPGFIDTVNADPAVSTVVHVGDIHSGKQICSEAYDRQIAGFWTQFADPLVFTPGDNEWADCHKVAEGGGKYNKTTGQIDFASPAGYAQGDPIANLALVRSLFFPAPGQTLGSGTLSTVSQATAYDPAHPEDAQYVENVVWQRKGVVFVTLNVPGGSNNDNDIWYGTPAMSPAQQTEIQQRTAADLRWLDRAFATAAAQDAQGVVVIEQADLWDLDGVTRDHLTEFEPIVSSLAAHTTAYGKPVLLLEGDSHIYRSDNPLQQGAPCEGDVFPGTTTNVCSYDDWNTHPFYDVPNLHRVVVHGSTTPLEYLRLTATPGGHAPTTSTTFGPFSWERVPVS